MASKKASWVQEELKRGCLQPLLTLRAGRRQEEGKETAVMLAEEFCGQAEQVEEPVATIGNPQSLQDDIALVALLKACAKQKDLCRGSRLHADVLKRGLLEKNIFVGNSLINMYVKCGALETAQEVFDELPFWDVVSWTALISGYCEYGHGEEALNSFDCMKREGLSPDPMTFSSILKACGSVRDIERGKALHAEIVREGWLCNDNVLGSALLDLYAKCGALAKAQQVFDELPVRDLVSWNALVAGYAQHGYGEEALNCFEQSLLEGVPPDLVTFTCILKACASVGAVEEGKRLHAEIVGNGFLRKDIVLGSALVDMYAKCGTLARAQQAFDELPSRNEVSWTGLITGYCQHMHCEEALICFEQMKREGLFPDRVTFACILKACGSIGATETGKEIHGEIVRLGLLGKDTVLGNALVDMYGKCGSLLNAQEVFDNLPVRNLVSWNSLITGYSQHGHSEEALNCFEQLEGTGLSPDAVTFACILKACGSIGAAEEGKSVHAEIVRKGLLGNSTVLGNALVDMYAKCGALAMAQQVFNELPVRDVVSWNALITGYCAHGHGKEGINLLDCMKNEGHSPDAVTFACLLKSCGSIGAAKKGEGIHDEIVRMELLGNSTVLGNALVNMYGKCGVLTKAQQVFDELPARDVVSWNSLITGYCKHGHAEEALKCFEQMECEGLSPDAVTFVCALKACSLSGATEKGKEFFSEIVRKGLLGKGVVLGNTLVSMYAKCGVVSRAHHVFDKLPFRDIGSWNALIAGYGQHGHSQEALNCFEQLKREGLSPDLITFACILKVCGRIGAAEKGQMYFESMGTSYGVMPTLEHHTCMVRLFSCAGLYDKAMDIMKMIPSFDCPSVWSALMGACQLSGLMSVGRMVLEQTIGLDEHSAVVFYSGWHHAGVEVQHDGKARNG